MTAVPAHSDAPLLAVRDLQVHFPIRRGFLRSSGRLAAVDGVSFELGAGETLGVLGESGCGKSTLARALLRLVEPTGGRIFWRGRDLLSARPSEMMALRREMQIIFQDPIASLDPRMTIGETVGEPLVNFHPGMPGTERRRRVAAVMEEVGLAPAMIDRYPHEVSGGQAQRIGIARAMVTRPRLIVCDEPVSALDMSIRAQILNLLRRLQRDHALSLIFISHDLSVVRHVSHRIMVMYLGRQVEMSGRDRICGDPRHPFTRALISAVPFPDPDRERARRPIVLSGELPSPLSAPSGCRFRTRCPIADHRCAALEPALEEVAAGHRVACHAAVRDRRNGE